MQPQNAERAAPALAGSDPLKSVQLGGGDTSSDKQRKAARQRLIRLTALLDALATWRDDIAERIARARQMQDVGCLFAIEQDDLIDAVRAWKLAASRVVLDYSDERRRAA